MYIPAHFEETDPENIRGLIANYPLATLVSHTDKGLNANHLPILQHSDTQLIGHIAMENDLHRELKQQNEVMVIYQGAESYISPNWYLTKKEDGKQVPTWNYQVAHIYGRIDFYHDTKTKRAIVGKQTKYFETLANGSAAWRMADAPSDYMEKQIDNIVAFTIEIDHILAKSKLNQNKADTDRQNVAQTLRKSNHHELYQAMRQSFPKTE